MTVVTGNEIVLITVEFVLITLTDVYSVYLRKSTNNMLKCYFSKSQSYPYEMSLGKNLKVPNI